MRLDWFQPRKLAGRLAAGGVSNREVAHACLVLFEMPTMRITGKCHCDAIDLLADRDASKIMVCQGLLTDVPLHGKALSSPVVTRNQSA